MGNGQGERRPPLTRSGSIAFRCREESRLFNWWDWDIPIRRPRHMQNLSRDCSKILHLLVRQASAPKNGVLGVDRTINPPTSLQEPRIFSEALTPIQCYSHTLRQSPQTLTASLPTFSHHTIRPGHPIPGKPSLRHPSRPLICFPHDLIKRHSRKYLPGRS